MKLQLTIASFTICLLFSPMLRAQESPRIVSYDLTVQIDVPNRQVEVGGSFEVDFHDSDSISLVLWRHARIDTLRHSSREITYRFDTLAPAPAQFIPDGRTLTLYRPAGADDRCRVVPLSLMRRLFSMGEARITLSKFSQGCSISHIPSSVWEIIPEPLTV